MRPARQGLPSEGTWPGAAGHPHCCPACAGAQRMVESALSARAAMCSASVTPPCVQAPAALRSPGTHLGAAPQELGRLLQGAGAGRDRAVGLLLQCVPGGRAQGVQGEKMGQGQRERGMTQQAAGWAGARGGEDNTRDGRSQAEETDAQEGGHAGRPRQGQTRGSNHRGQVRCGRHDAVSSGQHPQAPRAPAHKPQHLHSRGPAMSLPSGGTPGVSTGWARKQGGRRDSPGPSTEDRSSLWGPQ